MCGARFERLLNYRRSGTLYQTPVPQREPYLIHFILEARFMSSGFWEGRSTYAHQWLVLYPVALLVAGGLAWWNPPWGISGPWDNRGVLTLAAMASLLVAPVIMHGSDKDRKGWGFKHVWVVAGNHETNAQAYVSSVLSAESIRAAMTAGILAMLLNERKHFLNLPKNVVGTLPLGFVLRQPVATMFSIIAIVLGSSLVTTMVALLCYEYATRFSWNPDWPRIKLLSRAFWLGRIGFYCLMWSLAGLPALLDFRLGFFSFIGVFFAMWYYYFFEISGVSSRKFFMKAILPDGTPLVGKDLDFDEYFQNKSPTSLLADVNDEQRARITWESTWR
jgi:hypothetical protein